MAIFLGKLIGTLFDPALWVISLAAFFVLKTRPAAAYGAAVICSFALSKFMQSQIGWRSFTPAESSANALYYAFGAAIILTGCFIIKKLKTAEDQNKKEPCSEAEKPNQQGD